MIGPVLELFLQNIKIMVAFIFQCMDQYGRFQSWFDKRFGWFFTNGMKQPREERPRALHT